MSVLDYINKMKDMYEGPRITAQEPRIKVAELDNFNTPDLEQSPDSFLRPGETLEDWDVSFRRPNAEGGRIGFKKGLSVKQQQKIIDAFPDIDFEFTNTKTFGIKKYTDPHNRNKVNKDWTKVDRFIKKGFTTEVGEGLTTRATEYKVEKLSLLDQEKIKSQFELPKGVKKWDFTKPGQKWGIKAAGNENLIAQMKRNITKNVPWTVAADRGTAKGWMIIQMNRVYENEKAASKLRPGAKKFTYEPIFDIFDDGSKEGRKIIVGFKDNTVAGKGKTYYGLDKYTKKGAGDWTKHGDWKLNRKLIDIAKRSGNVPNDVILGLLKDRGFKNLDGKLKLNHLIHFLSGTKGTSKEMLKNAIVRHHQSGVAFGSATDDLALTTQTINKRIVEAEKRIRANNILPDDVQLLKNNNVYVRSGDGTLYGSGKKTPIGHFKQIESSVATALESGVDFKGKKFDNKKLLKFFKDAGIPCIKGVGGQCDSIIDYQKGYNQIVKEGAEGSAEAIQKLKGFTKAMRGITGVAKWTGYGLLAEAGFMVPFAIGDYAAGESWKRILGNATDYGFGPIFGQSEFEEFKAALPEGSKAVEGEKVIELGERLTGMEEQQVNPGYGRVGYEKKAPEQRQKVYEDIFDKYKFNLQPFMKGPAGQFFDKSIWTQAHEDAAATRARIAKEKLERLQKRRDEGTIAQEDWMVGGDTRGYMGGGMVGIRKPHAIPPERQGLRSIMINGKKS